MSFERNWTLREERPDYFNSRVTERVMTLNLSIKRRNGRTEDVGRFRIDMEQLAAAGFAHRHVEGGKPRYVVQINHVNGRDFTLATMVVKIGDGPLPDGLMADVLDALGGHTAGWTLRPREGELAFAHTPEFSDPSGRPMTVDQFLQDMRALGRSLAVFGEARGIDVYSDFLLERVYISGKESVDVGGYHQYAYGDDVAAGAAREQWPVGGDGAAPGPDVGAFRHPTGDAAAPGSREVPASRVVAGPPEGRGGAVAPEAGGLHPRVGPLGGHLDRPGRRPQLVVERDLERVVSGLDVPASAKALLRAKLRLGQSSPIQPLTFKAKAPKVTGGGRPLPAIEVHMMRTDGQRALVPSGKVFSFADLDYLRRRPLWLVPLGRPQDVLRPDPAAMELGARSILPSIEEVERMESLRAAIAEGEATATKAGRRAAGDDAAATSTRLNLNPSCERRGWMTQLIKSAYELLTGQKVHDWLTLLGHPPSRSPCDA